MHLLLKGWDMSGALAWRHCILPIQGEVLPTPWMHCVFISQWGFPDT